MGDSSCSWELSSESEEELDVEKNLGFDPKDMHIPREDDTYSPVHDADSDSPAEETSTDKGEEKTP